MRNRFFALALSVLIFAAAEPARAAEPQPGDPCPVADRFIHVGGPENPGAGTLLVCNGTSWQLVTEWDNAANLGVKQAAPKAPLHVGGEAILGISSPELVCDADRAGGLRWNATKTNIEMCDGTAWKEIVATTGGVNLRITPSGNTSMDVAYDGTNIPTVGAEEIFTVTNTGDLTSNALSVVLTGDTGNFTITVDTCSAVALAKNDSCEVRITPQADGNYIYRGALEIQTDNAPTANLEGQGSGFGCDPGISGFGGIYAACGLTDGTNTYDLIVTPGGCDGTTNEPTCDGSTDSVTKKWGDSIDVYKAEYNVNGPQNTVNIYEAYTSGLGLFPAAQYCMDMIYSGYDDWYLLANDEWRNFIHPNQSAIGGFANAHYWASRETSTTDGCIYNPVNDDMMCPYQDKARKYKLYRVRCARRHDVPLPAAEQDTTPDAFTFENQLVATGARVDSNTVTVNGITGNVSVSLTGSNGSPAFKINGGAEVTSGTVAHGDTLTLVMTSAASTGVDHTVTVTVGTYAASWTVSTKDCLVGAEGKGGIFAACGASYDFVVAPSGCTDSATPACAGGTDTVEKSWGSKGTARGSEVRYTLDGPQNSVNLMVFVDDEGPGAHPAAEYCMNMVYGGYDDWYLPASDELQTMYDVYTAGGLSGFLTGSADYYWTSREYNSELACGPRRFSDGSSLCSGSGENQKQLMNPVRCARRDGEALPAPTVFGSGDATPDAFSFTDLTNQMMNTLVASNALTITGFDGPKIVRATGSGNPELRVNGGTWGNDLNINPGDTLEVRQTTSTAPNTTRVATVTLGTVQDEWAVTTEVGEIPVGNTGLACDGTTAGYVRYDSGTVEYCDGTSWSAIGGGLWADLTGGRIHYGSAGTEQVGVATNDPKAALHVAGEAIVGNTGLVCDADRAGGLRWNATKTNIEMCDGTAWKEIVATTGGVNLRITPSGNTTMDVAYDGTNIPTVGAEEIFTVTNTGDLTSNALSVALTGDTANFTITVDTCSAVALAKNETCEVRITPQADGNYIYRGALEIQTDNAPTANLEGEGSGFGCDPGVSGFGGIYAACGLSDGTNTYDLVVTPGGCDGTTNEPTCDGSTDSVKKDWGDSVDVHKAEYNSNGPQNTVNINEAYTSGVGTFPAAQYCMDLVYSGYSDWYLPADEELKNNIYPNKAAIGGFASSEYWSSHETSSTHACMLKSDGTTNCLQQNQVQKSVSKYIRCARRHDVPLPAAEQDTNPDNFSFPMKLTTSLSTRTDSDAVTITGITGNVDVSISGSNGSPAFKINGGAEATSGTVRHGDTLALVMTSAGAAGSKYTMSVTVGTDTASWSLATYDPNITRRVFVTSKTYNGNLGSASGADNKCQSLADTAGIGGTWKAIISGDSESSWAVNRIPFNWGTLKNMNDETIATSWNDLWDGSLSSGITYNENYNSAAGVNVFTGSDLDGTVFSTGGEYTCKDWTDSHWGDNGRIGTAGSTGSEWITTGTTDQCDDWHRLYCIEDTLGDPDTTPNAFSFDMGHVLGSTRAESNTVTIGGLGGSANVSVSGSNGSPAFKINGGAEVTTGTVSNGDTLTLVMTAPTGGGAKYTMDVTVGTYTTSWDLYGADNVAKRVFVTSTLNANGNLGGVGGADIKCQQRADAAALGGTWKAIISGHAESEWAVNRIGYNWSSLQLVTGETVVNIGDLWKTDSTALMSAIHKNESGNDLGSVSVATNTRANGTAEFTGGGYACSNWTSGSCCSLYYGLGSSSGISNVWTDTSSLSGDCRAGIVDHFYCIEQ